MRRPLGVNAWVWVSPVTTEALRALAPKVAALGFELLEIGIEDEAALDYAKAARVLRDHGLSVTVTAAMSPERDLLLDETLEGAARYLRHCLDACEVLGASILAGPMYAAVGRVWTQTEAGRARDLATLAERLRPLADYAEGRGVTLCLEPLNRFETSFLNTAVQMNEVVDAVGHPACKVLLDTFHMNIEEKSLGAAIRACGHRLGHVHACENDRGAPGSGHVPWGEVRVALDEVGYAGPVVIESFTAEVKSIARAAAIWRPFEPSQDALAANGLAFLREVFV